MWNCSTLVACNFSSQEPQNAGIHRRHRSRVDQKCGTWYELSAHHQTQPLHHIWPSSASVRSSSLIAAFVTSSRWRPEAAAAVETFLSGTSTEIRATMWTNIFHRRRLHSSSSSKTAGHLPPHTPPKKIPSRTSAPRYNPNSNRNPNPKP